MQIVAEGRPANPKLAFERWVSETGEWVACSFQRMKPWDIWRYSMCNHSDELGYLVPSREMLARAHALKSTEDEPSPVGQLREVRAWKVKRDQQIFLGGGWWRVLGNHQVEADCGPVIYIWREGNCGIEEITELERFEPGDLCVVK